MLRIGAHMSVAGGVSRAIDRAVVHGCEALQIFRMAPHWSCSSTRPVKAEHSGTDSNIWRRSSGTWEAPAASVYAENVREFAMRSASKALGDVAGRESCGIPELVTKAQVPLDLGSISRLVERKLQLLCAQTQNPVRKASLLQG